MKTGKARKIVENRIEKRECRRKEFKLSGKKGVCYYFTKSLA